MLPLFKHQEEAIKFILQHNGIAALYIEMGCGKTRIAIEAFRAIRARDPGIKLVVIAPLSLLESAWGEDVRRFSEFTYYNAHDNLVPDRLDDDILLINFESVIQVKNKHITKHIFGNMLVIDESSKMKNHKAKTTKFILAMHNSPKYKVIMSGTPAPNSPLEYWAQIEFLQEWTLHKSFFAFRNTYFHLQRGAQVMQLQRGQMVSKQFMREILSKGWKYEITNDSLAKLMAQINPLVFWAKKDECLDLPDQVDEVRLVELSPEQKRVYKEMERDLIAYVKGDAVTAQVALAKAMKLREVTSGFLLSNSGDAYDIND